MSQHTKTCLGSFLILLGTTIGAGILALPLTAASLHFPSSALLLMWLCIVSIFSALYLVEVSVHLPQEQLHYSSMAKATLGRVGQGIIWLACLLLLYSLTWAYFAGSGGLISSLIHAANGWNVSSNICQIAFAVIFGGAVYWSTRAVDILNRGLWSIKGISILIMLALLMPKIHWNSLIPSHTPFGHHALAIAAPIFVTAFGFHTVVPSLRNYLNKDVKKMRGVIIAAALTALVCYLIWVGAVLSIVPFIGNDSFQALHTSGSVGDLMSFLNHWTQSPVLKIALNTFANIAMTTSFLGVTLGLFDFIADALKRKNSRMGRFQTAVLTFLPPLLLSLHHSDGFMYALGYAGIFVSVICLMMPAVMAFRLRQKIHVVSGKPYRVWGGNWMLGLVFLTGLVLIFCQLSGS